MTPDETPAERPPRSFGRTLLYVLVVQAISLLLLWVLQAHYNV